MLEYQCLQALQAIVDPKKTETRRSPPGTNARAPGADGEHGGGRAPHLQKSTSPQIRQLIFITNTKNKLTDLYGNRLLQNEFMNTLCEMNSEGMQALMLEHLGLTASMVVGALLTFIGAAVRYLGAGRDGSPAPHHLCLSVYKYKYI